MKINEYLCSRRGYKKPKISTIVDSLADTSLAVGYKKPKISTIVDKFRNACVLKGYKKPKISTIVDRVGAAADSMAIRSQKFLLL